MINSFKSWEGFIIAPKLDGVRALFVIKNNTIMLVFESKTEIVL